MPSNRFINRAQHPKVHPCKPRPKNVPPIIPTPPPGRLKINVAEHLTKTWAGGSFTYRMSAILHWVGPGHYYKSETPPSPYWTKHEIWVDTSLRKLKLRTTCFIDDTHGGAQWDAAPYDTDFPSNNFIGNADHLYDYATAAVAWVILND